MPFSCSFREVKCTLGWSDSTVGQLGVQSVTHLGINKKIMDFFFGQNLFHVIYNQNPRSNGPLKNSNK